jgi:hypothetical protein
LAQDRREIGIDHRGIATPYKFDQRRDFVADRDLRKPQPSRERSDLLLVGRMVIAVHEHDRDGSEAVGQGGFEIMRDGGKIGRSIDGAVGADALVDFDHALIQHVRLDDLACEDFWPCLIADLERVAESPGNQEERARTLALEQRIGGNSRAHFDRADRVGRDRLVSFEAEKIADPLDRGVLIGLRVFREELMGFERAVRTPRDDVGKGAATINPKVPFLGCSHPPILASPHVHRG